MSLEPSKALEALLWAPPPSSAHPGSSWQCQQQSCLAMVICCVPNWALPHPPPPCFFITPCTGTLMWVMSHLGGVTGREDVFVCVCAHSILLFSHSVVSHSLRLQRLRHARLPCPSPSLGACSDSCPFSHSCHLTILSSVFPFSFCLSQNQGLF